MRRFNWQIWTAFLLSIFALLSYFFIFSEWPITRDLPWVNLLLFAIVAGLLFVGLRRAFGPDRGWLSKIGASLLAAFSVLIFGLFVLIVFVAARWMPESAGAPQVGQKAPEFTLTDTTGKQVSLSQLLRTPIQTSTGPVDPKGVLLIFYRGYW
jgi:hypothetical protein